MNPESDEARGPDFHFSTASQIRNRISGDRRLGESSIATVRAIAALLRERHPELCEPPWTPVSEGMPTESGTYEVTVRHKGAPKTRRWIHRAEWWAGPSGGWMFNGEVTGFDVLAWRPAPAPWSGGAS